MATRRVPGKDYEKAVFEHYKERDRDAEVLFDHKVRDRDTGDLRQADVWIKTHRLGQPYQILVSCKDHARKLTVNHVEALSAEVRSFRADKGVLYSRTGFGKRAVVKARALDIDCCCLYKDRPPDKPSEVYIDAFVSYPSFVLMATTRVSDPPDDLVWRNLLPQEQIHGDVRYSICALIPRLCLELVASSTQAGTGKADPTGTDDQRMKCRLQAKNGCPPFQMEISVLWHWYRSRLSAYRLNGAMKVTRGSFDGTVTLGPIPMLAGPDIDSWERCARPAQVGQNLSVCFTLLAGLSMEQTAHVLAPLPVFGRLVSFPPLPSELVKAQLVQLLRAGNTGVPGIQLRVDVGRNAR